MRPRTVATGWARNLSATCPTTGRHGPYSRANRSGSEIFLVSTDERDITNDRFLPPPTVRGLKNRAFVVKINRLFRY